MERVLNKNTFDSGYLSTSESNAMEFTREVMKKALHPDFADIFGKPVDVFETVIISDIHLGDKFSRAQELLLLLNTVKFKRLIINGDVFDDINMKRLNRHHWRILSRLRELTDKDNNIEVIWIRGNHDGYSDLISQLLGIQFINEYLMEWDGKRVLIIHGDIFDQFTMHPSLIGAVGCLFYQIALYMDPAKRKVASWLKRNSKLYQRNLEKVSKGAIHYARHHKADIILCGHTHCVEQAVEEDVLYINSGSWTAEAPSHFIGFTEDQLKVIPFI